MPRPIEPRAGLLLSVLWLVFGCHPVSEPLTLSGPTMGTSYTVKIARLPAADSAALARASIAAVLAKIDTSMSGYRTDSEISRFNAHDATDWFAVSAELATVVAAAQRVSEQSAGALDITVLPLVNLWGFGAAGPRTDVPDDA